jgi:hypothetical protein
MSSLFYFRRSPARISRIFANFSFVVIRETRDIKTQAGTQHLDDTKE